ncbi:C-type lectin domain-containing protein [Caenorhabditis elegans]|uniref:C-type lectin domain-containing protein n=1 Tax=Caenorhabditis elegans TaxID=6239 RepID=Q9N4T1_CAEEL|nr:C-type lectin domain-containing protein [Caenorhabditis elegans]CCD72853.1 C-type lectin domain-containing protein [Caenorhabditis elegans]|eukprot:NP_503376.2 C-type LECtin [Caenorhabditis elegans]
MPSRSLPTTQTDPLLPRSSNRSRSTSSHHSCKTIVKILFIFIGILMISAPIAYGLTIMTGNYDDSKPYSFTYFITNVFNTFISIVPVSISSVASKQSPPTTKTEFPIPSSSNFSTETEFNSPIKRTETFNEEESNATNETFLSKEPISTFSTTITALPVSGERPISTIIVNHGENHENPPLAQVATCPDDWMTYERPQGRWCMKAFYGKMSQSDAEAECNAVGAKLSGLQNANERMNISYVLRDLVYKDGGGKYTAWLGGKRKASCPTGASCARLNSIEWTDGHTTGTDGFSTGTRELDGTYLQKFRGVQQCLHMIVTPYSDTELGFADFVHGSVDDEFCTATWVKAYVCGKLPS